MPSVLISVALWLLTGSGAQTEIYIPTSELLRASEMAARDEGFPIEKVRPDGSHLFFFDIAMKPGGTPLAPGYTSMSFYGNAQIIRSYSVNEQTGQIVDIANCSIFDFPNLRAFAQEVQREAGTRPETIERLAQDVGCGNLTVVNKSFAQTRPRVKQK